jgi:hypothetical protein
MNNYIFKITTTKITLKHNHTCHFLKLPSEAEI